MKTFTKYFLHGVFTLLPLILTIYPLYYFFVWSDSLANRAFVWLFPGVPYIAGTGIVIGLIAIFILGLLMSTRLLRGPISLIEELLRHIPLVKTLYNAIKELTNYLAPDQDRRFGKVVAVKWPGLPVEIVGFITRPELKDMPKGIETSGKVVVYIPMSYQVGGFSFFLPKDWLTPVDLSVDDAMKHTLTGWITK
ncbi:MAG: DUF502 domain-containing protein [Gammaproteobacteria bacterium]|nr:DUF502 domain-containing protein [Gammaproteobacteria bacterium]